MAVLLSCGIALLTASWSAYVSLSKARDEFYQSYEFSDIFAEVVRAPSFVLTQIQNLPGVDFAESRITASGLIDLESQNEPALGLVISIPKTLGLNRIHLRGGRWPEVGSSTEVLVHESFALVHKLKAGDIFFINIKGQRRKLQVSGIAISPEYVYALNPLAPFPDDRHFAVLWMLESALEEITGLQEAFNGIVIKSRRDKDIPGIIRNVDLILAPYGGIGAYDRSQQISNMFVQDEIRQQRSMSYVVPTIFILVAIFILHTVLHRLISIQRPQIATLKSLGYASSSVALHYWKLVTVILSAGLIPGFLFAQGIGLWYASLYRQYFRFPSIEFSVSPIAFIIAISVSFIPGWLVVLNALRSIFRLQPAEAMRPLTTLNFQMTRAQTLFTTQKKTLTKIILRDLLARPIRTSLSVLGLAAAVAILINGTFWGDVVSFFIHRQFREASREDLEVRFVHPRKKEVVSELLRIPGVEMVEGARIVGVKMIFRNIRQNTAVITTQENPQLRRALSVTGNLIRPLPGTVLLTRYYKEKYDLTFGDRVTLEISDKSHKPFSAVVGGFVDDMVGAAVYATKSDLQRWLHEESAIDSVYLKVDPKKVGSIYVRLKSAPEVLSVQVKSLLLQSFNRTVAEMITVFKTILIGFAISITCSVLFNMSRINISEKSWELASMKIMGFKNSEIFQILFLEIGAQVLVALGPGCILGYYLSLLSTRLIHSETMAFPLIILPSTYALAIVVVVLSYTVIGIYVRKSITRLNMTEALKARD
ncbi:ABC transporter permease [Bdellovibrio bacteriovorus]|nr:ABC transporter permease [Bdellovibrio bacteriovorus]